MPPPAEPPPAPVPEEPLAPVTPVLELLPVPPLGALPELVLPVLPDPELPLVPLLLDPLPCCRHFVRSAPVRPVHWLDELVLPPALPPLPDVPLLLPELMPDEPLVPELELGDELLLPELGEELLLPELGEELLLPEVELGDELLLPEVELGDEVLLPLGPPLLLDCAHYTAATPTSAAVTAALITVFTMVHSSQLKWKTLRTPRCKRDAEPCARLSAGVVDMVRVVPIRQATRGTTRGRGLQKKSCRCFRDSGTGAAVLPSGRSGPRSRARSARLSDRRALRVPGR